MDDDGPAMVHLSVFHALKSLVAEIAGDASSRQFGPQDLRVAAAVLLVHVTEVDGERSEAEADHLLALLRTHFSLDEASARMLVAVALRRGAEAVDFDEFATTLTRALDEAGRREIVAMMWELARADGVVSEVEESAIWRVARLLGVLDPKSFAQEALRKV